MSIWCMKLLFISLLSIKWTDAMFSINGSDLVYNNTMVNIRGINWYGFETDLRVIEGLWIHSIDWYLDLLKEYQFNALRIPISEQLILYEPSSIPAPENIKANHDLLHVKSIDILKILFEKCQSRGIAILLDLHVLKIRTLHPLWYLRKNKKYTEKSFFDTWKVLLNKFGSYPNLIGIELMNEPHDDATFGSSNKSTDIDQLFNRFMQHFPETPLIFMDGIWWGKDFRNASLDLLDPSRVVFSPHFYGPTLAPLPDYSDKYINWYYNKLIGSLIGKRPIVITEWGFNPNTDMTWVTNFIEFMKNNSITNSFFWSLNPDGKDVKGLLTNWTTIEPTRYKKIVELCPSPSNFTF